MARKRPAHPGQADLFDVVPVVPTGPAALAGSRHQTAHAVAQVLKEDPRTREVIAAEMSVLMDEEISKAMLDAYASPARDGHNISWDRMKALIVVTGRIDILRREIATIGVTVVDGNGLMLAELGHIDREMEMLKQRRRTIQALAQPIGGEKRK